MAQKKMRPASPCQAAASLGNLLSSPDRSAEYTLCYHPRQEPIDIVGLLAARARVSVPTARLHAELFGFGGAHV